MLKRSPIHGTWFIVRRPWHSRQLPTMIQISLQTLFSCRPLWDLFPPLSTGFCIGGLTSRAGTHECAKLFITQLRVHPHSSFFCSVTLVWTWKRRIAWAGLPWRLLSKVETRHASRHCL